MFVDKKDIEKSIDKLNEVCTNMRRKSSNQDNTIIADVDELGKILNELRINIFDMPE